MRQWIEWIDNHVEGVVFVAIATVVILLATLGGSLSCSISSTPSRTCFSAKSWDADDNDRPCVSVQVYEDGSFSYRVTDARGTHRYAGNVGAKDR
jgi:hypothetical protein